jgi:hypothetical protein
MKTEAEKRAELLAKYRKKNGQLAMPKTELAPDTPAPHLAQVAQSRGPELTASALVAWNKRLAGEPLEHVAHALGLSIEAAKALISEAHAAISVDLKSALAQNRELDLERTDMLLKAFLPLAKDGDGQAASIVLKALAHRARLVGLEAPEMPGHAKPHNVLVWIQQQLPAINKIVEALPPELP